MARKDGLESVNAGVQYRQTLSENDEHFVNAVNTPELTIHKKHYPKPTSAQDNVDCQGFQIGRVCRFDFPKASAS
jgi:hypothetical protein